MYNFDITKILDEKKSMFELMNLIKKRDKLPELINNKKNNIFIKKKINEIYIKMFVLGYIPSFFEDVLFVNFKINKKKSSYCNENIFDIHFRNNFLIKVKGNYIKIKNIHKIIIPHCKLIDLRVSDHCKFVAKNRIYNLFKDDLVKVYWQNINLNRPIIKLYFYNKKHINLSKINTVDINNPVKIYKFNQIENKKIPFKIIHLKKKKEILIDGYPLNVYSFIRINPKTQEIISAR